MDEPKVLTCCIKCAATNGIRLKHVRRGRLTSQIRVSKFRFEKSGTGTRFEIRRMLARTNNVTRWSPHLFDEFVVYKLLSGKWEIIFCEGPRQTRHIRTQYRWPSQFADFLYANLLIRDLLKYTKIQYLRYIPSLIRDFWWNFAQYWVKRGRFWSYSAPSKFAVSIFAVFEQNKSTANYKGRLYWYFNNLTILATGFNGQPR
jgi:hypothetical protein